MKTVLVAFCTCFLVLSCGSSGPEGTGEGDCSDLKDNDGDGRVDCEDDGCENAQPCLDMASAAMDAEREAREAERLLKEEAAKKAEAEKASEFFELGDILVQKGSNGANITQPKAAEYCEALALGGFEDWRLPTEGEAVAVAKSGKLPPEPLVLWTSTPALEKKRRNRGHYFWRRQRIGRTL